MPANTIEDEKRERLARPEPERAHVSGGGAAGVGETVASRIPFTFPDWQRSIEATKNLVATVPKDGLSVAASSLHDQANFLKDLAESKTPSELLKRYLDFAEKFWSKFFSEGSKILDHLKPHHLR
ncbi:hypothetical protein ABIA00_003142 [Bradyrhizobium ottawaense]|uniref:hypothetical protein n=1 Tax=Bradyrhizobium ottawaense TaxID=931866 RepID=UPI003836638C